MLKLRTALELAAMLALAACNKPAATTTTTTTAIAPAAATPPSAIMPATAAAVTAPVTAAALVTAPAAASTAGKQDWTQVIAATPEGGFRMGNPDAKVKLLEFASLTCPHCREFHEQALPVLKSNYVASGKLSYEYRPFILNGVDFPPSLLVRCEPAPVAFNLIAAFYENQPSWTLPYTKLTAEDSKRLQALPAAEQIKGLGLAGGLDSFVRSRGIPRAKFDQCLTDQAGVDKLSKIRDEATNKYGLTGTPWFVVNGTTQKDVFNWAMLRPKLDTALQ